MTKYAYERLTVLDHGSLLLERPNAFQHVALTHTYEAGPFRKRNGGIDADGIRAAIASGLHRIPRYRQRLMYVPFENHPVWVDDHHFDLGYHIRHASLPQPGNEQQLKELSAWIMQQPLDRSRPLWETWVVEGLDGDRFALVTKVHHCMVDGVAGIDLLKIQMRPTPDRTVPEARAFVPRPAPSRGELLLSESVRRGRMHLEALRDIRTLVRETRDVQQETLVRARAVAETIRTSLRCPSETPLNHKIGPNRRFDWLTMQLEEVKTVRRALGGSVNDVVLAIVTGAVRSFLRRRKLDPNAIEFRVLTPVSVRREEQHGTFGNHVSAWILDLPVQEADPREQLRRIRCQTQERKRSRQAVGPETLTQMAEWISPALISLGVRNATRRLPFNLVVTNVPGPQVPMYLLGARMLEAFPLVPLVDNLGLGIALMSYDGAIYWGFNADYDLLPDLSLFVRETRESFDALRKIAEGGARRRQPSGGRTPAILLNPRRGVRRRVNRAGARGPVRMGAA